MACEHPEDSERPISHWTQQEIADEAIRIIGVRVTSIAPIISQFS